MRSGTPPNEIVISPRPRLFSVAPVFPKVKSGHEALVVRVDWSGNDGFWKRIVLRSITRPDGSACDVKPREVAVDAGDSKAHPMQFGFRVTAPEECKFDVEFVRAEDGSSWVVDPGLLLQPGP